MSHATTPTGGRSKKPKIDWDMVIEKAQDWMPPKFHQILMRRFDIPSDAATARTPESEEDKMVPLFIPPQYEVNRLIDEAQQMEMRANAGGLALGPEDREDLRRGATDLRVKAIALHLGIES